MAIGVSARHEI